MKLVVCVKQVPSSNEVRMDPVAHTIVRDARQSVINPFDIHAVEQAVQLKEQLGGQVTVVSMGIPATEKLLRDCIARGADNGLLFSDIAFAGADTLATARTLRAGIAALGDFSLILCGKMAIDGDTAQIGPELAEMLGIPHVTDVECVVEADEGHISVRQRTGHGLRIVRVALPALITVVREINLPRLPSIAGIRHARTAEVTVLGCADLGLDPGLVGLRGSPTQVVETFVPAQGKTAVPITGDADSQAGVILGLVKEAAL